jgi:hypothetical protein
MENPMEKKDGVYKFLHSRHFDSVLNEGLIKIGISLPYFRRETVGCRPFGGARRFAARTDGNYGT